MFNVRLAETRSGGAVNEDIVGHIGSAAWVIDGASGVGENLVSAVSDAHWFAQRVDAELRSLLTSDPTVPFDDLFATIINRCAAAFTSLARRTPEGPHELPCAAMAFVRVLPDKVELATLGDCQILYRLFANGPVAEHGSGSNIAPFEDRTKQLAASVMAGHPSISRAELFQALKPQLVENRAFMNTDGGYWVLGLQPEALRHADRIELPLGAWSVVLMSDGFLRLSDMFDRVERSDLLSIKGRDEFEHWYSELRRLEEADGSFANHPRAKISDDASFVRIDVCTNNAQNA